MRVLGGHLFGGSSVFTQCKQRCVLFALPAARWKRYPANNCRLLSKGALASALCCQRMQGPTYAELFEPFPKVWQWLSRVAAATEPHWSDATTLLRKVAQQAREAKLKEMQSKL